MAMAKVSKRRQVINFLMNSDKGITESEARNRYGLKSLASTMHTIKKQLEANGNWSVTTTKTPRGKTRYFITDTHSGTRTYGFDRMGKRYAL